MGIVNYIIITIYSFGYVLCLNLSIHIEPKIIRVGEELKITCEVTDEALDKGISMLLRCPSNNEHGFCILNCDSLDVCSSDKCDRKSVEDQPFQCKLRETLRSLTYSYTFFPLKNSFINNRQQLPFTCKFREKLITEFAEISPIKTLNENSEPKLKPNENFETKFPQTSITTERILTDFNSELNINRPGGTTNFNQSDENLFKFTNLFLFGTLLGLFISLFINIWCCVQCCLRKFKSRKLEKMYEEKQCYQSNNDLYSQYYSQDFLKRAKSHPNLTNNERISSAKLSINNATRKPIYRRSTQTFEDVEPYNGSIHSIMNPIYNQMVLAPIQCIDQSVLPLLYPTSYSHSQNVPLHVDFNKSQNNLDIFVEQDIHEHQIESQSQPLPRKPD